MFGSQFSLFSSLSLLSSSLLLVSYKLLKIYIYIFLTCLVTWVVSVNKAITVTYIPPLCSSFLAKKTKELGGYVMTNGQ